MLSIRIVTHSTRPCLLIPLPLLIQHAPVVLTMVMPTEVDDAIIRPITTSMFEELHDFLETHFFPDAPLSASLGLSQRTQFWTWAWVRSCLMEEESMAALDPETGRVIGVIIGKTTYLLVSSKLSLLLCKSLFLGHVNV